MNTVKVKSTDPKSQGPFVVINEAEFNPKVHKLYEDGETEGDAGGAELTLENLPQILKQLKKKDDVLKFAKEAYELDLDVTLTRDKLEEAIVAYAKTLEEGATE